MDESGEDILSKQLLRVGTSIGANVRETESAQSRADFISKCAITLKECDETGYWLELLVRTSYLANEQFMSMEADRGEVFALLTSIIKTAKSSPQTQMIIPRFPLSIFNLNTVVVTNCHEDAYIDCTWIGGEGISFSDNGLSVVVEPPTA